MDPPVAVVVVTFNSEADIEPCLESVLRNGCMPVVVDNGSTDQTLAIVRRVCPDCCIVNNPLNGYARGLNLGVAHCSNEILVLSNADVIYPDGSIAQLVTYLKNNPNVGVLGPQQVYPDGSWQRSWGFTPGLIEAYMELLGVTTLYGELRRFIWPRRLNRKPSEVGYLDGASLVVSRVAFDAVGGFDEEFPFYGEESDFCLRVRGSGLRVMSYPVALVVHRRGASSSQSGMSLSEYVKLLVQANRRLVLKRHSERYYAHFLRVKRLFNWCWAKLFGFIAMLLPDAKRQRFAQKGALHAEYARQFAKEISELNKEPLHSLIRSHRVDEESKRT